MNIHAKEGAEVHVTAGSLKNGYPTDQHTAGQYLKVGVTYHVEKTVIHSWHTDVYLKEFPGTWFNSVNLEDGAAKDRLIIVVWPEVQELFGKKGFAEHSQLLNSEDMLKKYGSDAYAVEERWLNAQSK
jgi:hypothetical protein